MISISICCYIFIFFLFCFYFVLIYLRKQHTFNAWQVSNHESCVITRVELVCCIFFRSQWLFELKRLRIHTFDSDFAVWVTNIGSFKYISNRILTFSLLHSCMFLILSYSVHRDQHVIETAEINCHLSHQTCDLFSNWLKWVIVYCIFILHHNQIQLMLTKINETSSKHRDRVTTV